MNESLLICRILYLAEITVYGIQIWLKWLIFWLFQISLRCNFIFSERINVVEEWKKINLYVCQWWLFVTYECIKMHCCFIHTFKIDVRVRYCKQVSMNVFSLNTNQLATEYYHILSQLLRATNFIKNLISLLYFNYFQALTFFEKTIM